MQKFRRIFIYLLIVLLALLIAFLLMSPSPKFDQRPATPEKPFEVQLAWFYRPPEERFLQTLAQNFDFFILVHKTEQQRDQLRSLGVTAPILQYLLLAEIRDPGNCKDLPFGNQVAFHTGDFCMIDSEHPDWFLLDEHGNRIGGGGVYWMDVGNPGFRAFWLARARELQEQYGWNGIFIDNTHAGLGKFRSLKVLPQKYRTDEDYRAAVRGFLEYLRTNYFFPSGRKMYANITDTQDYAIWSGYLDFLDGVFVENFAAGWPGQNKSRIEWEEQMHALEEAHSLGKITLLVSQGEHNDTRRQQFSFASYLLIANEITFFRYALSGFYNEIWLYENYRVELGSPVTARYREGEAWRRDFRGGYVLVNPGTLEAEIVIK